MVEDEGEFYALANLYLAYRKAKYEAFYESTHFHALAFTRYEQDLDRNLRALQRRLETPGANWFDDRAFIGDHAYLPKAVDPSVWDTVGDGHFRALDPRSDWLRRFQEAGKVANATLRLVIRPSVDFQVVSALWIVRVGHLFDASLDHHTSFGNRLRRSKAAASDERVSAPGVNVSTPGLFAPYFSAYQTWRERGLSTMEQALHRGESILAITMDVEKFYHRVSPKFLLRPSFLDSIGLTLSQPERRFTRRLLRALDTWYRGTPDYTLRPEGAIPVGLSASKILANVVLVSFDRAVVSKTTPLYYGRYVDDVFLVLKASEEDYGARSVTKRLVTALAPLITVERNPDAPDSLKLHLPYARDSELVFAGPNQKIFSLSSAHGSDLVRHIRDQIREQSSEYRLLASVPQSGIAMASRAILAAPNASMQVDALRKADVVSVRRLGFSLLLSDIETYAADLRPNTWQGQRQEFYGLVSRHIVTPTGFFEFFGYIPRVFGLMLACGDKKQAQELIDELAAVANLLITTTSLGSGENRASFSLCLEHYAVALLEAGLQAATARTIKVDSGYLKVLRRLKVISKNVRISSSVESLQALTTQLLLADWGRRPYKDYWFLDQHNDEQGPRVPRDLSVRRQLRLGAIRRFRQTATDLKTPHWPALAFPTRPLRVDEIGLVAPRVLWDASLFKNAIKLLRGAGVASSSPIGFRSRDDGKPISDFLAPDRTRAKIRIAVTSVATTNKQWKDAALGKPDRSVVRYREFNGLINRILKEAKRPDYIVMPELSVPLRWALRAARKLAMNGASLLVGVEYNVDRATKKLRNDCLVSLTTSWPGCESSVVVLQPKFRPAHGERSQLKELFKRDGMFFQPSGVMARLVVYAHGNFYFSVLICSDLTNISHRHQLRGEIDALFVLEWNQDTKTFSPLVESTASDLHAFVVQTNNRRYGDSRIRAPADEDYARDVVQVKGGIADYYVLGEIDYLRLRAEQRRRPKTPQFKPVPIGYVSSPARKGRAR